MSDFSYISKKVMFDWDFWVGFGFRCVQGMLWAQIWTPCARSYLLAPIPTGVLVYGDGCVGAISCWSLMMGSQAGPRGWDLGP